MNPDRQHQLHIVIVGPCAAGKSTLLNGLIARGFDQARVVAQEHSGVRDLWKIRGRPDCLIYLDARLETIAARQHRSDWTVEYLAEMLDRLKNARSECDMYLPTDELTIEEVLERTAAFLIKSNEKQ